jgi:hypothetical protein
VTPRASYWKTTALSFFAASVCLAALAFVLSSKHLPPALVAFMAFLIVMGFAACLLITSGGLICLWRDAREVTGKEDLLTRTATERPTTGLLSKFGLRLLWGAQLRPGDLVQVRLRDEIKSTLDERSTLDGLPFMSEMDPFCGRVFQVHRRVDHINDMRNKTGLRRMHDVVTLTEVRCSGSAHDGCQAECQILWKDAWLKRVSNQQRMNTIVDSATPSAIANQRADPEASDPTYFCQMTALWEASKPMSSSGIKQNFRPLISGNIGLAGFLLAVLTRTFNLAQRVRGGADYPYMPKYPLQDKTWAADLHLDAGDAVVVRNKDEIARTLVNGRNKGLWFDRDMIRFCNQPATVRKRVHRIIHEGTGKMVVMKAPCVMLENVVATGEFLRLCPQQEYIFWREIWLRRSTQDQQTTLKSDQ